MNIVPETKSLVAEMENFQFYGGPAFYLAAHCLETSSNRSQLSFPRVELSNSKEYNIVYLVIV